MRVRQIITTEEADAASTTSGDIASVAYPLFVAGRTRRARRKNARRAVGQRADSGASYIGRGVYESHAVAEGWKSGIAGATVGSLAGAKLGAMIGMPAAGAIAGGIVGSTIGDKLGGSKSKSLDGKETKTQDGNWKDSMAGDEDLMLYDRRVYKVFINGKDVSTKMLSKREALKVVEDLASEEVNSNTEYHIVNTRTKKIEGHYTAKQFYKEGVAEAQELEEAFDQPYKLKWYPELDMDEVTAYAEIPNGDDLSIMFNLDANEEGEEAWSVEFYRNDSQAVTGEGDAQRIFATVLVAIRTFIKKYKPNRVIFSASKEVEPGQKTQSRANLYDRLVQRYAKALGFKAFRADAGNKVHYELNRINKGLAKGSLNEFSTGGDDGQDPFDAYPCYDCGSTIFLHHTKSCDLAEPNAMRDLPEHPGTQHWTGEIPKGLHPIPGLQEGVAETALQGKEDLDAKRRVLQDLEREPGHDQEAIRQRKLDLEKEARAKGIAEAHTLNSDSVIYRLDREDPMNASEVLVLGGAGRYSLAGLRDKARREARALAADLEGNHGGAFRGAAHNIKQLTNTLNTIVAAYNELKRIRSRGGRGSRGITDEDANFIRECLAIAEQWTQRYIAENGRNTILNNLKQEKEIMIRIQLVHEGRVVKQISSSLHESVILEQVKRYQDPIDAIVIVEGRLSEDAKSILGHVAKKIIPAAMAAGIAMGGASAQAQGGANPHYPGLNHSVGSVLSDIFSPNYRERVRQRDFERETQRRTWDAQANVDRQARIDAARQSARQQVGASSVKIYDQARVSQDGKSYILYDMENRVTRIPVAGTEFMSGDSQRLPHYITRNGSVYYVRHAANTLRQSQFSEDIGTVGTITAAGTAGKTKFAKTGTTTDVKFNNKGQLELDSAELDDTAIAALKKAGVEIKESNSSGLDAILDAYPEAVKAFKEGEDLSDFPDFYDALYEYYFDEMPYGVAKARDGDPINWISDRLQDQLDLHQPMEAHADDDETDPEAATAADQSTADKNIIMQVRKASDYEKPTVLNLGDGSTKKIDALLAKKLLGLFDGLKPQSKELMQNMLNSQEGFAKILDHINEQEIKESLAEIDQITNGMKPVLEMTKQAKNRARSIINAAYAQVSEQK